MPQSVGASLIASVGWKLPAAARAILVGASLIGTVGCSSKSPNDVVVAKAGEHEISAGLFAAYTKRVAHGTPERLDAAYRERLLQQLVQLTTVAETEAARREPDVGYRLELQRLELLAKAGATRAGVFTPPTSVELQQAYDAFVKAQPPAEFHVAHILVPTESIALGLIRQLNEGGDFAALARTQSADDSRHRGGDLGWIRQGKLPKPFTDAVAELRPGTATQKPVNTPYGWHVIRVLEARPAAVPALADVRAQLAVNLQQQRYEAFLQGK
jgi:peptidyl-prolyl cis-trans isomerase C